MRTVIGGTAMRAVIAMASKTAGRRPRFIGSAPRQRLFSSLHYSPMTQRGTVEERGLAEISSPQTRGDVAPTDAQRPHRLSGLQRSQLLACDRKSAMLNH